MDCFQYPTISSFRQIELTDKPPFVLCDIDETVLYYKYSFQTIYNAIEKDYKEDPDATPDFLLSIARRYYSIHTQYSSPKHTDLEGFDDFLERIYGIGGELCFLTARGSASDNYTKEQLTNIGIEYKKHCIHYCAGVVSSKGEYIEKYIDISDKQDVIFIDDYDHNIVSVLQKYPHIRCYKFDVKREEGLEDFFL